MLDGMATNLELIKRAFANVAEGGRVDMVAALSGEPRRDGILGLIAPGAEIRFLAPDQADPSERAAAFRGVEGYLAGWLEWLQPYTSFNAALTGLDETEGGRVLLEIEGLAALRGSGIEVAMEAAALYSFEDERIVCAEHYMDRVQARREAGLL
jgi:ketosteroid isomerase-like protein